MHLVAAQGADRTADPLTGFPGSASRPVKVSAHLKMWTDIGWVAERHDTYLSASSTLSTVSSFFKYHELIVS